MDKLGVNLVKYCADWIKTGGKSFVKKTVPFNKKSKLFYNHPNAEIKPDIAYHGSPFNFDFFDASKLGSGEGLNKYGSGLYITRTKKLSPFYANIRSKDAPLHFGNTKKLDNPQPTIYTISGLKNMKFKQVSNIEAKFIRKTQNDFETKYPQFDGLELDNQIVVFPKSLNKLKIDKKQNLKEFINENKGYPFRVWTTERNKLELFT